MILNEEIDEDYEPNEDELMEYAKFLGMEFPEDDEYLYIAREGLKAPLPEPWKPCQTKGGDIYFFNFDSGESVWEHPCDTYYKDLFTEAKSKKKVAVKKPPLQESKDRQKKPVVALPKKSISPVGFDKKRDLLSEIIQLEKETKENKQGVKDKFEGELEIQFKELSVQRDIEVKLFKELLEKESKKKKSLIEREIEMVEETEKKNFEEKIAEKTKEIVRNMERLLGEEKRKVQEKVEKEIKDFEKEQASKKAKALETEKQKAESEKKGILRQLEEQKELCDRVVKNNSKLEGTLQEEYSMAFARLKKSTEKQLEDFRREEEYEVQKAMVSARNRKSQLTLQEKIRELREEYKVKEEVERRNAKREYEDEVKNLYTDFSGPLMEKETFQLDKERHLQEAQGRFKIAKREEILKIDQENEKLLTLRKEILEREYRDKISMFKAKQPVVNYSEIEQKDQDLQKELFQTKEKVKNSEETLIKLEAITADLKRQLNMIKNNCEHEQENLPKSEKIKEMRQKLAEKDYELEQLKRTNPSKLITLENELKEIKSLLEKNQDRPVFHYEEHITKKVPEEEIKENLILDEDLIGDWRKDDSWNISRDISPVGVRKAVYKRPQFSTRTWVKPREEVGRFSAGKHIGSYLY